jgi:hypothetical protein
MQARMLQDLEAAWRQGNTVLAPGLDASAGDGPRSRLFVDLIPTGADSLARTRGSEDQKLEREPNGFTRIPGAQLFQEQGQLRIGESGVMSGGRPYLRQHHRDAVHGIVSGPLSVDVSSNRTRHDSLRSS